jgi:hypothetical protein
MSANSYFWWCCVGLIFNKWIRDRLRGWWLNYNYILSAALDSGLAFGVVIVFLAVQLNPVEPPKWWGNTVVASALDATGKAVKIKLPAGQTFGPTTWI